LAPEAGYYGGLSYQKAELYYKAHIVYNKILTQYPHSKRTSQIIKNEYEIGEIFLSGKKRKVMGIELLPALSTAEEIFKSIVESNPYSKYGDDAQYQLGQVYKKMGNYSKAEKAFEAVIKNYPDSPLAEKARYQIALTSLESSKASEYEQKSTEKAIEGFEEFIEEEPPQELKKEAEEAISKLKDKKAKHDFDIAKYYEDNSEYKAAVIYYQSVINEYPQSIWAKKAKERIEKIEKNQNEK
jgi:outer membrane protein assembly factor BamD